MCEKCGNLKHISSACHVALEQARSRLRHSNVLRELTYILEIERKKIDHVRAGPQFELIKFVEESQKRSTTPRSMKGILDGAPNLGDKGGLRTKACLSESGIIRPEILIWSIEKK